MFFDRVCVAMTPGAIDDLARADYGEDYDSNVNVIRALIVRKSPPSPLEYPLLESLELRRWCSGGNGHDYVISQLFACATLLLASCDRANERMFFGEPPGETLGTLVGLVRFLGEDWLDLGVDFVAHFGNSVSAVQGDGAHEAFAALAMLILLSDERAERVPEIVWRALVDHAFAEDRRLRDPDSSRFHYLISNEFVLGLTNYDQRHDVWRAHIHERFDSPPPHIPSSVRDDLQLIASQMKPPPHA